MGVAERSESREALSRAAALLASRFIGRQDIHPLQLDDGRYVCVHRPLSLSDVEAHLQGQLTLGAYLLDSNSRAQFIVLDADNEPAFQRLVQASVTLAGAGAPNNLERSRRGGHLWFFFDSPLPARQARAFGKGVKEAYQLIDVELYPKQDKLTSGPGSLIRLPLGVHRLSHKRYSFCLPDGQPLASSLRGQIELLARADTVSEQALWDHQIASKDKGKPKLAIAPSSPEATLSARVKASVSVFEFVSQYVELSPTGSGRCPFHDDEYPSFSVSMKDNYWHCFTGCGGGSVIDFWAKWRERRGEDPAFAPTLKELASMLL